MKSSIILFTFLPLALLINACNWSSECKKVKISHDLVEWANCYNEGDTIVLKSNLNNYDSLVVNSIKREYSPCNKFELGPNQYESMIVYFNSISKDVEECKQELIKNRFVMLKLGAKKSYNNMEFKGFYVYNLKFDNFICKENESTDSTISCDNRSFISPPLFKDSILSFKFDDRNAHSRYPYVNSEYPCAIKSFHWSKEYGLVQYETEDDEVYRLIKK